MKEIMDWLSREGGALLSWWALSLAASVAIFPLWFRFARGLPSRGYGLARAGGILLIAFTYWILNIFGILRNTPGNIALVAIVLFIVGIASYATWQGREPLLPWLRAHIGLIVATELVFAIAFVGWAFMRSLNPEQASTEKPMEMAFLAASRRSEQFPPNDPWLSGYAISYYHFGYIIMGMFANLSAVSNGLAFGLSSAFLFALTSVGAFSVAYDLVAARLDGIRNKTGAYLTGLLAVVMIVLMGNLGAFAVELPYQTVPQTPLTTTYFNFMDVRYRDYCTTDGACSPTGQMPPSAPWWWFNLTRIIRDRDLNGSSIEIISEFPIFSFLLSDIHPHVLALPFVMLALGMLLNLVMTRRGSHPWEFLIYVICIGGLVFLNTWDAVFLGLLVGAEALRRLIKNGTGSLTSDDWLRLFGFAALVAVSVGVLYLPFLVSFRSQAGGFVPNIIFPTRFQQFLLMFGALAFLAVMFGIVEWRRAGPRFNGALGRQLVIYGAVFTLILFVVAIVIAWIQPDIRYAVFKVVDEAGGLPGVIPAVLIRRLGALPTMLFLGFVMFLVIGRLFAKAPRGEQTRQVITYSASTGFALLLIGGGAAFAILPEFAYIRDNFSSRINMIFKLYYQAWAVWSIGGAYAVWSIVRDLPEFRLSVPTRAAIGTGAAFFILAGVYYTPNAIQSRLVQDGGHSLGLQRLSLDGSLTLARNDDDKQIVACLQNLAQKDDKVIVEAMDEVAYAPDYGRISALSGIPTLLGWPNHERQWRGATYDKSAGTRLADITRFYNTQDAKEIDLIVRKYNIDYVVVGNTERTAYLASGGLAKFESLQPVCRSGASAAYDAHNLLNTAATPPTAGG